MQAHLDRRRRHLGDAPVSGVAQAFGPVADIGEAQQALRILTEDVATIDHLGPRRYAAFLGDPDDELLCQDAVGVVLAILAAVRVGGG